MNSSGSEIEDQGRGWRSLRIQSTEIRLHTSQGV